MAEEVKGEDLADEVEEEEEEEEEGTEERGLAWPLLVLLFFWARVDGEEEDDMMWSREKARIARVARS